MCGDHQRTQADCCDCPHCRGPDQPPDDQSEGSRLAGWRLVWASVGLFLGPLAAAILGAVVAGKSPVAQLSGATIGLGVGLALSVAIAKFWRRDLDTAE